MANDMGLVTTYKVYLAALVTSGFLSRDDRAERSLLANQQCVGLKLHWQLPCVTIIYG